MDDFAWNIWVSCRLLRVCGLVCCWPLSQPLPRRGVVFGYFVIPNWLENKLRCNRNVIFCSYLVFRNLYPYALFCQIPSPRERGRERGWFPLCLCKRFFALLRMTYLLRFFSFVIPNLFRNLYLYALVKDCGLISFTSRPLLEILNQVQDDIFGLVSSPWGEGWGEG